MKRKNSKRLGIVLFVGILLFLSTPSLMAKEVTLKAPYDLKMLVFLPGSAWHVYGTGMAGVWKKYLPTGSKIDIIPSPLAGIPTPLVVGVKKEFNISCMQHDIAGMAYKGRSDIWPEFPKEGIKNIRVLASLMDEYSYGAAVTKKFAEKYRVWSIDDLVKKKPPIRLRTLPPGACGELRARLILKDYGLTYEDVKKWGGAVIHADFKTNVTSIMDGHADSLWHVIVEGHPAWTELTTMTEMVFLPMKDEYIKKTSREYGSLPTPLKKEWGFRGVTKDIPMGLGWITVLLVRDDMPKDVAYVLTKAIDENRDYLVSIASSLKLLNMKEAWKEEYRAGIQLHPGAEAYYKDKGYMK